MYITNIIQSIHSVLGCVISVICLCIQSLDLNNSIMKVQTWIAIAIFGNFLISCQQRSYPTGFQHSPYAGHISLADALKYMPGIQVSGSGDQIEIKLNRTFGFSGSVIYLVDGQDLGTHYRVVNESIDMNNVRSIHLLRSLADRTRFGKTAVDGAIEIWTK